MRNPTFKTDYTNLAEDIYQQVMWKGWKFKTFTSLEGWLAWQWSILFKRPLCHRDVVTLKSFLEKRRRINLKIKCKQALTKNERQFMAEQWIDKEGYICMTKMMPCPPIRNPKENQRLEQLLKQTKWKI